MYEDIIHSCRTLVALWDTYDELHFMRIHTPENCKAFEKSIRVNCKVLLKELKEMEEDFER